MVMGNFSSYCLVVQQCFANKVFKKEALPQHLSFGKNRYDKMTKNTNSD
jgi:hypothetical protein